MNTINKASNERAFTVIMHRDLVDELDECFSPMDGIQAINDVYVGLPKVHRLGEDKRRFRKAAKTLRLYHARLSWFSIGVSYVQIDGQLHILKLWHEEDWSKSNRPALIYVLPEEPLEEVDHAALNG